MDQIKFPYTRCKFGVAVRDVTPPVGIYARSWGAAAHDAAEGIHRPLSVTAALIAPAAGSSPLLALVAVDIGWFQHLPDALALRETVLQKTGLQSENFLLNMSHTHSSANANSVLTDVPGADLIKPYLAKLTDAVVAAINEAKQKMTPAWIAHGQGRCSLAVNRDYWDANANRFACGFNPDRVADDTVMVGRVTDDNGKVLATLFNYACHPTTLAWKNKLLSPDYIGAAREILERDFSAPALFFQGASGDLAPREGYVGDAAVADRNGRILGHAAVAALEALPPPATKFSYTGIVLSGADLGTWEYQRASADELRGAEKLKADMISVDLPLKDLPTISELEKMRAATADRHEQEKLLRRIYLRRAIGDGKSYAMPLWFWRLGNAAVVAIPNEAYSVLQEQLRAKFAGTPLWILGTTNWTLGYLAPRETYGKGIYQEIQSPFAAGCLEKTMDAAEQGLSTLFRD